MVHTTSLTLLNQLRLSNSDEAWGPFIEIYAPLILKWNKEAGLQDADAEDVAQEVISSVISGICDFNREKEGSFRKWLRRIAIYRIQRFRRKKRELVHLDKVDETELANPVEDMVYAEDYYTEVLESALRFVFREFREISWEAFLDTLLLNQPIEQAGAALGMTPNAIYVARSRILNRLIEVVGDFIQGDDLPILTVDMVERVTAHAARNLRDRLNK